MKERCEKMTTAIPPGFNTRCISAKTSRGFVKYCTLAAHRTEFGGFVQGFSAHSQGGVSSRVSFHHNCLSASSAMIHSVPEWQHRRCCQPMATSAARSSPGTSVPAVLYSPASVKKKNIHPASRLV